MIVKTSIVIAVVLFSIGSVFGQRPIPACAKQTDQLVGWTLRLVVPKETTINRGRDIDYSYWAITFSHDKERSQLNGFTGLNVGNGEPDREDIAHSRKVTRRYWRHKKLRGVDSSGTLKNGKRWRNFGLFGEVIWYHNVSADAAAYFDRLIATMCIVD